MGVDQLFNQMSGLVAERRAEVVTIPNVVAVEAIRDPFPAIWLRVRAGTDPVWIQREARRVLGVGVTVVEERG